MSHRFLLAVVVLAAVSCGPLGPFAGGRLRGSVALEPVPDWSFADSESTAQLETRGSDAHSVNVWFAGKAAALYVPSSMIRGPLTPNERTWVRNASSDPAVRIRIAGEIYERRAVRVEKPGELAAALAALVKKYELSPEDLDPKREIWIFRLDPR